MRETEENEDTEELYIAPPAQLPAQSVIMWSLSGHATRKTK